MMERFFRVLGAMRCRHGAQRRVGWAGVTIFLSVAAVLSGAAWADGAEAVASRPARRAKTPKTPWSVTLPADRRPEPMPMDRAGTVDDALAFTEQEKAILADVSDGDGQLNSPALYVLLRRARMLPEGAGTFDEAEQPNPRDFWREPKRYRARLVRLDGRYAGRTTDWSKNVVWTRWWGERGVWLVDVYEPKTRKPLLVMMTQQPSKALYQGRPVRVAGIFYKVVTLPENPETGDPSRTHEYPVIVAGAFYEASPPGGGIAPSMVLAFAVVIVMLFVFMMLRRSVARRRGFATSGYRPLRFADTRAGPDADTGQPWPQEDRADEEPLRLPGSKVRPSDSKGENADNT